MQVQYSLMYYSGWTVENKGIQITSDIPVSLIIVNYYEQFMESMLVKPTRTLGTGYYALTGNPTSGGQVCQVIALPVANNTSITITLTDGSTKSVTLNELETIAYSQVADLSGTKVEANRPIAVIADCILAAGNGN